MGERERTRKSGKEREALGSEHENHTFEYDKDVGAQALCSEHKGPACEHTGHRPLVPCPARYTSRLKMPTCIASTSHVHVP